MSLSVQTSSTSSSNVENLPPHVIKRISKELLELSDSPPEGIKLFINEEDITDVQASIQGPGNNVHVCMAMSFVFVIDIISFSSVVFLAFKF